MINLLSKLFEENKIGYLIITGSMTVVKREKIIE